MFCLLLSCVKEDEANIAFPSTYLLNQGKYVSETNFQWTNETWVQVSQESHPKAEQIAFLKDSLDLVIQQLRTFGTFESIIIHDDKNLSIKFISGAEEVTETTPYTLDGVKLKLGNELKNFDFEFSQDFSELYLCNYMLYPFGTLENGQTFALPEFDYCTGLSSIEQVEVYNSSHQNIEMEFISVTYFDTVFKKL